MSGDAAFGRDAFIFLEDWEERYEDLTYLMWTTSFLGSTFLGMCGKWKGKT